MRFLIVTYFALVLGCMPRVPSISSNSGGLLAAQSVDCKIDDSKFPKILEFSDPNAQSWLYQLSDCERRNLLMHAEGAAVSTGDLSSPLSKRFATRLIPMSLRYVEAPRSLFAFKGLEGDGGVLSEVSDPQTLERIGADLGLIISSETVKIPIHPTTRNQHPLVQWLIDQKYPLTTGVATDLSEPTSVIGTMSRSVWYRPLQKAATIKLGSDYINGRKSENKLTDVAQDVFDLQDILQNTSIPQWISSLDVTYLVETKAVTVTAKDATKQSASLPYGVALRDYTKLIQDKSRIYIPLALLEDKGRFVEGCSEKYLIPYSFNRFISLPKQDMEKLLYELNQTLARVIAIHHANGYMPIDFHGQNLIVGIPLDPNLSPRLVIRDVADIYPFAFEKTHGSSWGGIKKIEARGIRRPNLDLEQAGAYKDQMKRLGFKLSRQNWKEVPVEFSIRDMVRQYYEYDQKNFWSQVTEFRTQKCRAVRPKQVSQCVLRAKAFGRPQSHALSKAHGGI